MLISLFMILPKLETQWRLFLLDTFTWISYRSLPFSVQNSESSHPGERVEMLLSLHALSPLVSYHLVGYP